MFRPICRFTCLLPCFLLATNLVLGQETPSPTTPAEPQPAPADAEEPAQPPGTPPPAEAQDSAAQESEEPLPEEFSLAPLGETAQVVHDIYALDLEDCSDCHQNKDPKDPGPVKMDTEALCLDCHEEFKEVLGRKFRHADGIVTCTECHNPHNSKYPSLLHAEQQRLCLSCHEDLQQMIDEAPVRHGALATEAQCSNCHNPHSSDVEHLLIALPFDLCIKCHGQDGLKDDQGRALTNFKTLLEQNPEWHAPVAAKDCSACHNPHASANFRLLNTAYPPRFYSEYDPALYALCFECHNDQILAEAQTTTDTQFRDGSRNLHYLHVHKPSRGRTCRACHQVHASQRSHLIRESVPYGKKGWLLQLNYTRTETGGYCEKTCHTRKTYNYSPAQEASPANTPE